MMVKISSIKNTFNQNLYNILFYKKKSMFYSLQKKSGKKSSSGGSSQPLEIKAELLMDKVSENTSDW